MPRGGGLMDPRVLPDAKKPCGGSRACDRQSLAIKIELNTLTP
jgi:hypothetical protein